jgi:hypothetical protein
MILAESARTESGELRFRAALFQPILDIYIGTGLNQLRFKNWRKYVVWVSPP